MNALRKLENRILEELQDVHNIQRKLAKTQLIREGDNLSEADNSLLSLTGEENCLISPRQDRRLRSGAKKAKSKFTKNPNLCISPRFPGEVRFQDEGVHNKENKIQMHGLAIKVKSAHKKNIKVPQGEFKPTYYVLDNEFEMLMNDIDDCKTPDKKQRQEFMFSESTAKAKLKGENRRWCMAESTLATKSPSKSIKPSRNRPQELREETVSPKKRRSIFEAPSNKNTREEEYSVTNTPNTARSSKKKDVHPEFSFRPKLTAKSLIMAEAMEESAFDRLTRVNEKQKKPSSDELALLQCTFAPGINQKSVDIDHQKQRHEKRADRLFGLADHSKEKIERLQRSEFIKNELDFKAKCSFIPKTNKVQLPSALG